MRDERAVGRPRAVRHRTPEVLVPRFPAASCSWLGEPEGAWRFVWVRREVKRPDDGRPVLAPGKKVAAVGGERERPDGPVVVGDPLVGDQSGVGVPEDDGGVAGRAGHPLGVGRNSQSMYYVVVAGCGGDYTGESDYVLPVAGAC